MFVGCFLGLGWLVCFSGFERLIVLGCFLFGELFYSEAILGFHRHSHPLNCVGLMWGFFRIWVWLLCGIDWCC